jgi:hypothetical protein
MPPCQIICNDAVPRQVTYQPSNQVYGLFIDFGLFPCQIVFMLRLLRLLQIISAHIFRSRRDLLLENLTRRHQLSVLKRQCALLKYRLACKLGI